MRLWLGPLMLGSLFQAGCFLFDKQPANDSSSKGLVPPKVVDEPKPKQPPQPPPPPPVVETTRRPDPPATSRTDDPVDPAVPPKSVSQIADSVTHVPRPPEIRKDASVPMPRLPGEDSTKRPDPAAPRPASPYAPSNPGLVRTDPPSGERTVELMKYNNAEAEHKALEARAAQLFQDLQQREEALRTSRTEVQQSTEEIQKTRAQLATYQQQLEQMRASNKEQNDALRATIRSMEQLLKESPPADR
jgi:hypothetical protein